MRLPRFRLRTLMIAVAIAGLACGGVAGAIRLDRLSRSYRQREAFFAQQQDLSMQEAGRMREECTQIDEEIAVERANLVAAENEIPDRTISPAWAAFLKQRRTTNLKRELEDMSSSKKTLTDYASLFSLQADYIRRMRLKYERAARYPWLPLPDRE